MARPNWSLTLPGSIDLDRSNGAQVTNWPRVCIAITSEESVSGVQRKKPSGWMDPTPYTLTHRHVSWQQGSCYHQPFANPGNNGQWYKGVVGTPSGGGRFNGNDHFNWAMAEADVINDWGTRERALIAVRNNLKSTDINLGVAFGERKQTARLIGDTAIRLAKSVRHLKRGEIRKSMDALGVSSKRAQPRGSNVPQKWLELQYGWKPLLSDVYGAAEALSKHPKDHWRVTAKAVKTNNDSRTNTISGNPGSSGFDASQCRVDVERSVFARIDALPQNEALISLASAGVTNPLLVAWELVPFSFVVDWFIPIGSYVESLDAMLGYESGWYTSSLFVRAVWTDTGLTFVNPNGSCIINSFSGTKKLVYLDRDVSASVPLPSLPSLKDPVSLGHMANGLALLSQAFGRRR